MTQSIKEIDEMFIKGIHLSSGTFLTGSEVYELQRLIVISDGIGSYVYVRESVDDDEIESYPPIEELSIELFEDIAYTMRDVATGEDEIWAVRSAMKRREKKNE